MLSELIISGTLLINAAAVLNIKFIKNSEASFMNDESETGSVVDKIKQFIENIQYFRIFIALWNFFIIFLMFTFFGS
ncbi:unnamed protein product [Brachionus calyciflorus]|uniref:Uncharacterized protein n=1 Tax=Brachionus calyciflorus TaxID=104777 RepID=A0A813M407_9BILA|nr:unnamed protein product [Brachionus calyciflorus]